ncbi:MAG: hypothetical protein ACYSSI_05250 [Planctomycetota bacterium]|jgi:hypothetical protein
MNKTQKGAMAVLVINVMLLIFTLTIPIAWFNDEPILRLTPLFFLGLTFIFMVLSIILLRKKQSPCEVDYDERDITIKRKAIFTSYITLWILVFLACIIPFGMTDQKGTIQVSVLPVILFLMFIIVMLVYSAAVLIQYSRGSKGEKS